MKKCVTSCVKKLATVEYSQVMWCFGLIHICLDLTGQARLPDGMKKVKELKPRDRKGMNEVVVRKGRPIDVDLPTILRRTEGGNKEPKKIFFPAPAESKLTMK